MDKASLTIGSKRELTNGTKIPLLGLGLWQIPNGGAIEKVVRWALDTGYRHFDTAKIYGNEESVGKAIRESSVKREDVWVTTKLWPGDLYSPSKAFEKSLNKLGLEYIDLYLIHWPVFGLEKRSWRELEKIYESGKCKAIGVSNFDERQIDEILDNATYPPMVNQIKLSPFNFDSVFYEYLEKQDIATEAYSPLTRGKMLDNLTLNEISSSYSKSPAQLLIRWALQKNIVVIPKSQNRDRIVENAEVFDFEISKEDMNRLDDLSV